MQSERQTAKGLVSATRARSREAIDERRWRSFPWAGYAACAWSAAYAIGIRGYQGLGGTIGLPGQFEDPAAARAASLIAGGGLLLAGLAALGLVRPWGLHLPRWPVILAALAGSVVALTHALTAYVTKTLHLLGLIDLEFRGWARLDERSLIRGDLLFYEPWFLGLGVPVLLATLHHYGRTGGTDRGQRRLVVAAAAATVLWTTIASLQLSQ